MARHRMNLIAALLPALLILSAARIVTAAEGHRSFADALRASEQGHYAEAIDALEQLGNAGGWSAPLLYDLANAYSHNGNAGRAVLNYERAQLLTPRDPDIAANLALTRARAGIPNAPITRHEAFARLLPSTTWRLIAVSGLWLACAGFALARRRGVRRFRRGAALAAFVSVVALGALAIRASDRDRAVVVAAAPEPVRISPFAGSEATSTVVAGADVSAHERHGDFLHIDDGQGHAGWVLSSSVRLLVPRGG